MEHLVARAAAPGFAHIDDGIGLKGLRVEAGRHFHGRPTQAVKVNLAPCVRVAVVKRQRGVRQRRTRQVARAHAVALYVAGGDALRAERQRSGGGEVAGVAFARLLEEPRRERASRLGRHGFRAFRIACQRVHHGAHAADNGEFRRSCRAVPRGVVEHQALDVARLVVGNVQVVLLGECGVHAFRGRVGAVRGFKPAGVVKHVGGCHVVHLEAVRARPHKPALQRAVKVEIGVRAGQAAHGVGRERVAAVGVARVHGDGGHLGALDAAAVRVRVVVGGALHGRRKAFGGKPAHDARPAAFVGGVVTRRPAFAFAEVRAYEAAQQHVIGKRSLRRDAQRGVGLVVEVRGFAHVAFGQRLFAVARVVDGVPHGVVRVVHGCAGNEYGADDDEYAHAHNGVDAQIGKQRLRGAHGAAQLDVAALRQPAGNAHGAADGADAAGKAQAEAAHGYQHQQRDARGAQAREAPCGRCGKRAQARAEQRGSGNGAVALHQARVGVKRVVEARRQRVVHAEHAAARVGDDKQQDQRQCAYRHHA